MERHHWKVHTAVSYTHLDVYKRQVLKAVETRESGAFKIMMKECLKQCKTAPNLMVDSDSYGHVRPEEVAAILSKY